ncbi:MAG: hypothetical protein AAGI38_12410 [Bacteroidota bacterium]
MQKNILPFLLFGVYIAILPVFGQNTRGKLAGINSHAGRYMDRMPAHASLMHRLYLPEDAIIQYLEDQSRPQPTSYACQLGSVGKLDFQLMSKEDLLSLRKNQELQEITENHLKTTRRGWRLPDQSQVIELYNGMGVLFAAGQPLDLLDSLRFLQLENGQITWAFSLTEDQKIEICKTEGCVPVSGADKALARYATSVTAADQFMLAPPNRSGGWVLPDRLSVIEFSGRRFTFQAEATKYLSNQMLMGDLPHEVYGYLFHLSDSQRSAVLKINGGQQTKKEVEDETAWVTFTLADGTVLAHHEEYGYDRFFESQSTYDEYLKDISRPIEDPYGSFLFALQGYGKAFPQKANQLAASLAGKLEMPDYVLDGSLASLSEIDEALSWQETDNISGKTLLALIAYVGEVYRNQLSGSWDMKYDREMKLWKVQLLDELGNPHPFVEKALRRISGEGKSAALNRLIE